MDGSKLRQLWQSCQIDSSGDPHERRQHLIKLLDCCLVYFGELNDEDKIQRKTNSKISSNAELSKTTHFYIGNWLIHQFIIELSNLSESTKVSSNNTDSEYALFNEYFLSGIGWKFLQCFRYFNCGDRSIYNVAFARILTLILKTFLINFSNDASQRLDNDNNNKDQEENPDEKFNIKDYFLSNSDFKEDVYLKTLKSEFLSPAKVKSWIKNFRHYGRKTNNGKRTNHQTNNNQQQSDTDEDVNDDDFDINDNSFKMRSKNNELLSSYYTSRSISTTSTNNLSEENVLPKFENMVKKPSREKLISTIENILINMILMENSKNTMENERQTIISLIVIEELFDLTNQLIILEEKNLTCKLNILKQFKNILMTSCMVVCNHSYGIKLIDKYCLVRYFLKYVDFLQNKIKENMSDVDLISLISMEMVETICLLLRLMIVISQSLIYTKEVEIFHTFMKEMFENKIENVTSFLIKLFDSQKKIESMFQIMDLLKELQICIQFSQSLILHKRVCTKKRHSRCNLVPLMAHHFYHDVFLSNLEKPKCSRMETHTQCISSLVYCLLIKLILTFPNQNCPNEMDDTFICYISNQLSVLISCCCSLKKYCRNLLHFAIHSNRSNATRNTIFNIIEFNVKIQRKHLNDSTFLTDQCSFCTYQDICEKGLFEDNNDSIYSEGYSTDNGNSSLEDKLKLSSANTCSDSNCLIKSLSSQYITLLKCENVNTRQTVFRHLFNLFSYLNTRSRKSILLHVIFPIFENYNNYPLDVSFFVFRLLIAMTKQSVDRQSDILDLLNIFIKINALPSIKQFICSIPFMNKIQIAAKDNFHAIDLSSLSVQLFENLIKFEVIAFSKMVHNSFQTSEKELMSKIDTKQFHVLPFLIEIFIEQFAGCIKFNTKQHFKEMDFKKVNTLNDHINFYKNVSFNAFEMDEPEIGKLYQHLWCIFKMLTISNNILGEYASFRVILNHEVFHFIPKLLIFFQNFFEFTLNEIKLFCCLTFKKQQDKSEDDNLDIDISKYIKLYEKLLKIFEQLLFLVIELEPGFNLNEDFIYNNGHQLLTDYIETELFTFIDKNLLIWQNTFSVNLLTELLKIIIRVAFDYNENFDSNSKFTSFSDLASLDFVYRQERSSSIDSVVSDNENNINDNNTIELDNDYSNGYEADTECARYSMKTQELKQSLSNDGKDEAQSKNPLLKNVHLCRIVFKFISVHLQENIQLKKQILNTNTESTMKNLNLILTIVNLVTNFCKRNPYNNQLLFDNNFTQIIMEDFKFLLTSTNFEDKPVKIVLFELFFLLTKNKLRSSEIKMFIELFKSQDSDFEFLLSISNKIFFSKHRNFSQPQHCLRFPAPKINKHVKLERDWIDRVIDSINDNYTNCEYDIGFKSFACALPLSSSLKHVQLKYSLVFWIHFEKIASLVEKQQQQHSNYETKKSRDIRQMHIISFIFDYVILEIWFDYVYNRFIYRICKESHGKIFYLNESFVSSSPSLLGQWSFICVDLEEKCDPNNRSHSIQIGHNVNCSREKVFKWSYPANLFNSESRNNALLIGSKQDVQDFHFKLSNVFLFKDNLSTSSRIILYSLGPDFNQFHHLQDDVIQKRNYFILPESLVQECNVDMLISMLQASMSMESKSILDHLILVYQASQPNIFYTFPNQESKANLLVNPFRLLAPNIVKKTPPGPTVSFGTIDEPIIIPVKMNCTLNVGYNCGISKTISDSGGISLFIFLFLYLLEKSDNQIAYNKSLELILRVYQSHYYNKLIFDNHYGAYEMLLYVLVKTRKPFSMNILKTYSQFAIYVKDNHPIILSTNIEIFFHSWKIWIKHPSTTKLFFQMLNSLVIPSNPYRSYNLTLLKKIGAFSHLIYMIEDIHMNYFEDYNHLDCESLDQLTSLIQTMIENISDFDLLKIVFHCLLLLQNTEWLHVNQTKASFYYLFPSTLLTYKEDNINHSNSPISSTNNHHIDFNYKTGRSDDIGDDWEIVSEFFENASPLLSEVEQRITNDQNKKTLKTNSDAMTCELILLANKYLDQITDVQILDSIFENVSCLDFFIVLVNNPSERVRETALMTFFKLFKLHFDKNETIDSNKGTNVLKNKTLYLLMVSNQLYNYMANENIIIICLSFIFNINRKKVNDLLNRDYDQMFLRKILSKVSLEHFIPLLALLPKCINSISFCYKVLNFLQHIFNKMTIHQINELQKEYGLVQSLSKLLININTQLSITFEDINKYTREHLNEQVFLIVYNITMNYHLNNSSQYYGNYSNFINYYSIIERKVNNDVSKVFRQVQVAIFQASFDAFDKLQSASHKTRFINQEHESTYDRFDDLEKPFQIIGEKAAISDKVLMDRLKSTVNNAVLFIISREQKTIVSQKEKYFQRELLYHLLKIIDQCENIQAKITKTKPEKTNWTKLLANNKDHFKSHLNRIILFLMSHLQSIDDRIFSLNLFFEKTKEFDYVKLFIDKNDEQFIYIFDEFLRDLMDHGIKELNIYSSNIANDFVLPNYSTDDSLHQDLLSMDFVYKKFNEQFVLKKDEQFYKYTLANWHEQIQETMLKYDGDVLQSSGKVFSNMSIVFNKVLDSATFLNDRIILAQYKEKKHYILHLKQDQLKQEAAKKRLLKLIGQLLHEKSCWFLKEFYPESWELSPFECHGRIRKKMERCFLEIDNRYVVNSDNKKLRSKHLFSTFLEDNSNFFHTTSLNELNKYQAEDGSSLLYTALASVILYDEQIEGEILIKRNSLRFMANGNQKENCLSFSSKKSFFQDFAIDFDEIQEIIKCRYELQHKAMEIVLTSGLTYLIAFETTGSRDECFQYLISNRDLLPNLMEAINLVTLTQMWRERRISNFDYLMQLNKLSGRSFNDLMQYPVFPFVLADYNSDILNLMDPNSFRDLSRPIAVQKKEREKYYVDQYNYIKAENSLIKDRDKNDINSFQFIVTSAPYHYGAHYSNSGIVLYYLVRLPPYTQMFLQYQDKNFDLPDRSFHSIKTTWRLATEDSTNGFKELIPEFFYLPEFLMNKEHFNLGVRQNGEPVDDVILPQWCRNNARLFTLINLQALESNYVTQHLNHWFDLIFGFKQTGKAAVDAVNVFHPATHFTADLSKIEDEVKRHALRTMIKTFGQMPTQLFNLPHPTILPEIPLPIEDNHNNVPNWPSMGEVIGLKWGNYVGSPIFNGTMVCFQKRFSINIDRLLALPTNDVLLLPKYSSALVTYNHPRNIFINTSYIIFYALCTWSPQDSTIWFRNQEEKSLFTSENSLLDKICICQSIPDYEWLLIGYHSGIIMAFPLKFDKKFDLQNITLRNQPSFFIGHETTITSITINNNYHVALSTDQNGTCILWDMNKQQYLRTIMDGGPSNKRAILSAISNTLGDLAVITYSNDIKEQIIGSKLSIFTLNGIFISDVSTDDSQPYFTALCYSNCQEGLSINVIATGMSDGSIKLWSSWDLTLVRHIKLDLFSSPIKSISFSFKCDLLYFVNNENYLVSLKNIPSSSNSSSISSSTKSDNFRLLNLTNL